MAKKIKFPLILKDDFQVRTIDELREHFDLEKIISYYQNGKLLTWLEDRYYDSELSQIQALCEQSDDFVQRLCAVLGVSCQDTSNVDLNAMAERQKRLELLKQYTSDESILSHVDQVAFDQEELADLLDDGYKTIYLYNGNYHIPLSKNDIQYIGIGNVSISNWASIKNNYKDKHIEFINFEQAKKNYAYLWDSFDPLWKNYTEMVISHNPIKNFIPPRTPDEFYNAAECEHRSEKRALEMARNAVGNAYITLSTMFSHSSIYCIYGYNGSKFLKDDCEQTIATIIETINTLYAKAMELGNSIKDSETYEKYVSLLQPLQLLAKQFEKYKTMDQSTEDKIIAKLNQIDEQFNRNYTYDGCIQKVAVRSCFHVSQNKIIYSMSSQTGILAELCNYINKKLSEWCDYVEQLEIAHFSEPINILNTTTDRIYEDIKKLLL